MDAFLGCIILFAGSYAPVNWAYCWGQEYTIQQYAALYSILGTTYGGDGRTTFAVPDLRGAVPIGYGPSRDGNTYPLGTAYGANRRLLNSNEVPLPQHQHALNNHTHTVPAHNHSINSSPSISFSVGTGANADPGTTPTPTNQTCLATGNVSGKAANMYNTNASTLSMSSQTVNTTANITGNTGDSAILNASNGVVADSTVAANTPFNTTGIYNTPINPQPANLMQSSLVLNYIICLNGLYPSRD